MEASSITRVVDVRLQDGFEDDKQCQEGKVADEVSDGGDICTSSQPASFTMPHESLTRTNLVPFR